MIIADLVATYSADTTNFDRGNARVQSGLDQTEKNFNKAGASAKQFGSTLESSGGSIRNAGIALTGALTLPILAAGAAMLSAGIDYETALNSIQAVTKASGAEMSRVADLAKALGADLSLPATSAKDASLAMLELGKAGLTVQQAMDAARGTLLLAAAGQMEEAEAAEITANALNAFGLQAGEAARVSDLLAAAANASSAGVGDIALALKQAGAGFAAAKVPVEDLTAAIGLMANAGVKGSDAGTSLKTFLSSILAPSTAGAAAMQDLGVKAFDAAGRFKGLPDIIGQFSASLAGLTDEAKVGKITEIFGADASRAAQILFKDGAEGFAKMKQAVTETGAAASLAGAMTKGLGGAWSGFKSQMETLGIEIFEAVNAPLTDLLKTAGGMAGQLTTAFGSLSPTFQLIAVAIAGIVAAAGPVILVFGAIVSAIGTLVGSAAAIGTVGLVIAGLAVAFAPLIAVVAAWSAAWHTNFGGIRDLVASVGAAIVTLWNQAMTNISDLTGKVLAEIKTFWAANGADIIAAVVKVSEAIKSVWTAVVAFWKSHGDQILAATQMAWNTVKAVITAAVGVIGNVIKLVAAVINGDWSKAWEAMKGIVSSAFKGIAAFIRGSAGLLLMAVKGSLLGVLGLGAWLMGEGIKLGKALIDGAVSGLKSGASALASAARTVFMAPVTAAKSILDIKSPSKVFFGIGKDTVQGYIDGLNSLRGSLGDSATSIFDLSKIPGLKLTKADVPGIELLGQLTNEIARFGDKSKAEQIALDLSADKYGKVNQAIRERIKLAAEQLSNMEAVRSGQDKLNAAMEKFVGVPVLDALQQVNNLLKDPQVTAALAAQDVYTRSITESLLRRAALAQIAPQPADFGTGGPVGGNADPTSDLPTAGAPAPPPPPALAPWQAFWAEVDLGFGQMQQTVNNFGQDSGQILGDMFLRVGDIFSTAIKNWDGTFKGFFKSIAQGFGDMAKEIIAYLVKILIYKALLKLFGGMAGGAGGGGGEAGGGFDGFGEGLVPFAAGGFTGAGSKWDPAGIVHKGEYVMPAETVKKLGVGFMERIRKFEGFASGGLASGYKSFMPSLGGMATAAAGGSSSVSGSSAPQVNHFHFTSNKEGAFSKQSAEQAGRAAITAMNRFQNKTN